MHQRGGAGKQKLKSEDVGSHLGGSKELDKREKVASKETTYPHTQAQIVKRGKAKIIQEIGCRCERGESGKRVRGGAKLQLRKGTKNAFFVYRSAKKIGSIRQEELKKIGMKYWGGGLLHQIPQTEAWSGNHDEE